MTSSRLLAVLLLLGTALVYSGVLSADFVGVDDPDYVTENAVVLQGLSADGLLWAATTGHAGNWHPLTWISHMVDVELFGDDPAGHHGTNLALHLANTWLLFTLLLSLTGRVGRSAFVAAVFALHPVHVESVAWVSERKDVLSTFFGLLALLTWVRWTAAPRLRGYVLVLLCFGLSLLAKPMLVTLPAVLLLFDLWPLGRWRLQGHDAGEPAAVARAVQGPGDELRADGAVPFSRLLLEKLPLLVLSLASSVVTWWVQRAGGAMDSTESVALPARLANAVVALVRYVGLTLWPSDLGILHPHPALPGGEPLQPWQVGGAIALLVLFSALAWRGRRAGWPLVGWCLFVGMLVPVIGLVQVGDQALAERYLYLPMTGLVLIAAWGAVALAVRARAWLPAAVPAVFGGLILVACATLTWRQLGCWRSSLTLLEQALTVAPRSPTLRVALGHDLEKLGRFEEARVQLQAALAVVPDHPGAHHYLAVALRALGQPREAVEHYRSALQGDGDNPRLHHNLALALGSLRDLDGALTHFRTAIALDPDYASARTNLGALLVARGEWAAAEEQLSASLALDPSQSGAAYNLARALVEQQRLDEAERCLRLALARDDGVAGLHEVLGRLLSATGRCEEALAHLERALELAPRALGAMVRAAWIYATHPEPQLRNPERALLLAGRADELSGHTSALVIDTLAAAHAAVGDSERAAALAAEALALVDDPALAEPMAARLAAYRRGEAARDLTLLGP